MKQKFILIGSTTIVIFLVTLGGIVFYNYKQPLSEPLPSATDELLLPPTTDSLLPPLSDTSSSTLSDTQRLTTIWDLEIIDKTQNSITFLVPTKDQSPSAAPYIVYHSAFPITPDNWLNAILVTEELAPATPRTIKSYTVTGLSPSTKYYIALISKNVEGNLSLSGISSATTLRPDVVSSQTFWYEITIENLSDSAGAELHLYAANGLHTGPIHTPADADPDLLLWEEKVPNSEYTALGKNRQQITVITGEQLRVEVEFSSYVSIAFTVSENTDNIFDTEVDRWLFSSIEGKPGCTLSFGLGRTLKESALPPTQCQH